MKNKYIIAALSLSLFSFVSFSVSAKEMETLVVKSATYQMTAYDNEDTARVQALKKARWSALSSSSTSYTTTAHIKADGNMIRSDGRVFGLVVSEDVLSEEVVSCDSVGDAQCFTIKASFLIDFSEVLAADKQADKLAGLLDEVNELSRVSSD